MRTISAVWSSWGPSPQLRTFTHALHGNPHSPQIWGGRSLWQAAQGLGSSQIIHTILSLRPSYRYTAHYTVPDWQCLHSGFDHGVRAHQDVLKAAHSGILCNVHPAHSLFQCILSLRPSLHCLIIIKGNFQRLISTQVGSTNQMDLCL